MSAIEDHRSGVEIIEDDNESQASSENNPRRSALAKKKTVKINVESVSRAEDQDSFKSSISSQEEALQIPLNQINSSESRQAEPREAAMKRMSTRVDGARNDKVRDEYILELVNQVLGKSRTKYGGSTSSLSISEDAATKQYGSQLTQQALLSSSVIPSSMMPSSMIPSSQYQLSH